MSDENMKLARKLAEEVLMNKITPLIGKDYKNKIPALRAKIAVIRSGQHDDYSAVESAYLALERYKN